MSWDFEPEKIGFFHFGTEDRSDPCGKLWRSLESRRDDVRKSLLVLPEAFNIGLKYERYEENFEGRADFSGDAKEKLRDLAGEFDCAFVPSLIEGPREDLLQRRSSAYLITKTRCETLWVKIGSECMVEKAYTPEQEPKDQVVSLGRVMVAAMVCMDAADNGGTDRHADLQFKMKGSQKGVLCVPAYAKGMCDTKVVTQLWPEVHVVVSNGCPKRYPSIIRLVGEKPVFYKHSANTVIVKPLGPY